MISTLALTTRVRPQGICQTGCTGERRCNVAPHGSNRSQQGLLIGMILTTMLGSGCHSPYHADRGALFGGLTGAGLGAIVGKSLGNPLAGAAIGAGVGTMTGAAVGSSMDEMDARNRAEIEARLGRRVSAGAVSVQDVVLMTQSGVDREVIVNHVNIHGCAQPLQTNDLIQLQSNGVDSQVIQAMQRTPAAPAVVQQTPPPVIVEEHYYDDHWVPHHPHRHVHHRHHRRRHHHDPHVSWGVSFSNDH